ncbi:ABC transporter ATP-binding protein [Vagococcus sp. JNUCC 83]
MTLLEVKNVKKTYHTRLGGAKVEALKQINFSVESGEYVAIMGESGSGKSTLLNLLATLDKPTAGDIFLNGQNMNDIKEKESAAFRREHLGFVFQQFNLLDTFSVQDNILLPLVLAKTPLNHMMTRLDKLAPKLGLNKLLEKYPYELSGGQQQRVAAARALITQPDILLADEPTGALDSKTSTQLLSLFQEVNEEGQTIVMVTHSIVAASHANRVLFIKDGQVFNQIYRGKQTNDDFLNQISETMTVLLTGEA